MEITPIQEEYLVGYDAEMGEKNAKMIKAGSNLRGNLSQGGKDIPICVAAFAWIWRC